MNAQRPVSRNTKFAMVVSLAILSGIMVGCSHSNGSSQAKAVYKLTASGGSGGDTGAAQGGDGGTLNVINGAATTAGVEVLNRDAAKTTFKSPVTVPRTADLGGNPLNITVTTTIVAVDFSTPIADKSATTIGQLYIGTDNLLRTAATTNASYATDPVLPVGTPYVRMNDTGHVGVYEASGGDANNDVRFTGLSVASGATLNLTENVVSASVTVSPQYTVNVTGAIVSFQHDIQNDGIIDAASANADRNLYLIANNYYGNGTITSTGAVTSTSPSVITVPAGNVYIYAATGIANNGSIDASGYSSSNSNVSVGGGGGQVNLYAGGYVINNGAINVAGGDGYDNGGTGGSISMAALYTENDAAINANGGGHTDTNGSVTSTGGAGGTISILSSNVTNNTGNITAVGGDGTQAGTGGAVVADNSDTTPSTLQSSATLETLNAGNIDVSGGMNSGTATGGYGGGGGNIIIRSSTGGPLANSGDLTANGGNTAQAGASGGNGGYITIEASVPATSSSTLGDLLVSGNLSANGGNAVTTGGTANGGNGGVIQVGNSVTHKNIINYSDQRVALLGYLTIDVNGGDGATGGSGVANAVTYVASEALNAVTGLYTSGPVDSEVPINANGGNSTASGKAADSGGKGGTVSMTSSGDTNLADATNTVQVKNIADINANGGKGYDDSGVTGRAHGGTGGAITMDGYHGVNNTGKLSVLGNSSASYGGAGGSVSLNSNAGTVTNSIDIQASAGDGTNKGGAGNVVNMTGLKVTNSGSINTDGGNGTDTTTSYGGNGGGINLQGSGPGTASNHGTLSYVAGTGATMDGLGGFAKVDISCTGNCTP